MAKDISQAGSGIGCGEDRYARAYRDSGGAGGETLHCPDCGEEITGIVVDEIRDCADHLSHGELQEHYRWLKKEHKMLRDG